MKNLKRVFAGILIITTLSTVNISSQPASAAGFTDVKASAWYYGYVNKLINLKITAGIGNNKYGPNNSVTRAEFITFLCKANGLTQTDGYTFTDTKSHWAAKWISSAVTAKIIDQGTSFNPNKAITRQEAVEMLCRSLKLQPDAAMATPYTDVKTDAGYSNRAYEEYLMQGSIENGIRYFKPASNITRAETAAVIINLVDYKADSDSYKATKKAEIAVKEQKEKQAKAEAENYAAWKESVKNISQELLNNTKGLYKGSVYESNKYLKTETDYLKNWGAKYGMTEEEFADEMVRVGTKYGNTIANTNYKEISAFEINLKSVWETNVINNYLKKNIDYVKNNTIVTEGKFLTSTGMLVFADWGNPVLRGTMRCKYLSPTSSNVLNSDTIKSTGKHLQLGIWYEQDFEIRFYSEKDGIKTTGIQAISDIRISK
jgi:hypothetical protein